MIYSKKRLDFSRKVNYNTQAEHLNIICTRRSRVVRPSAHDWKSCNTHKVFEGSNPSFSAIITSPVNRRGLFFCPLHPKGNAAIFLPEIGGAGDLSMQKLLQFSQKTDFNLVMLMGNDNFKIRVLLSILVEDLL